MLYGGIVLFYVVFFVITQYDMPFYSTFRLFGHFIYENSLRETDDGKT